MEYDKIKDLFTDFNPELSSDAQFMSRLQRNMEMAELVKRQSAVFRKRNKTAVVVAALSGFVVGVLMTMIFSILGVWTSLVYLSLPFLALNPIALDFRLVGLILTAAASCFTVYNAYVITLSKQCGELLSE